MSEEFGTDYTHSFCAFEGQVLGIFTQRFATGFGGGACFVFTGEAEAGLSGGPVFNSQGYVCGLVSSTATGFLDRPSTVASLLYPALYTDLDLVARMGPLTFRSELKLLDLIARDRVVTDGSETDVTFRFEEGQESPLIGIRIETVNAGSVFDDVQGMLAGRAATLETESVFRVRYRTPTDSDEVG
ncbi:MAG TPA: hypothetical protein VFS60_15255 [Thermoanaerobaculia bacterium]|nr:hypothetical protein [Thermoanaerobaculia bacterium]